MPCGNKDLAQAMVVAWRHQAITLNNLDLSSRVLYGIRLLTTAKEVLMNLTSNMCSEHYCDVIMGAVASQITSLAIVNSIIYSDAAQRKHQSSASLAFVWGIHRGPVNSPHKWPGTRKMFPFDDVIMDYTFKLLLHLPGANGYVNFTDHVYFLFEERFDTLKQIVVYLFMYITYSWTL